MSLAPGIGVGKKSDRVGQWRGFRPKNDFKLPIYDLFLSMKLNCKLQNTIFLLTLLDF